MSKHSLIGIGGSAGALPALVTFLDHFRPEDDCALFIVIHSAAESDRLTDILQRHTALKVREPEDGEAFELGHVYVAPHDCHLLLGKEHVHLRRGPRENNFRPAIDPLLRSLAVFGSTRASAVILSGYLDDGAAGCRAMRSTGGAIFVQDPAECLSGQMPRSVISAVGEPDGVLPSAELGEAVAAWIGKEAAPSIEASEYVRTEMLIAGLERASMRTEEQLGELSPCNCPDCNGVLWRIEDGTLVRYRCHTGHAYTESSLDKRQTEMLERSLYDSLRALREKIEMLETLAQREPERADRWLSRAKDYRDDAETIEAMLLSRDT